MSDPLALLAAVDDLYASVVTDPMRWSEEAFAEWAAEAALGGLSRAEARSLRRCLRAATRLHDFWVEGRAEIPAGDWRARVDLAMGARAWRPALELALTGLDEHPSPELFAEVRERFRVVNGAAWMEDVDYETWRGREAGAPPGV